MKYAIALSVLLIGALSIVAWNMGEHEESRTSTQLPMETAIASATAEAEAIAQAAKISNMSDAEFEEIMGDAILVEVDEILRKHDLKKIADGLTAALQKIKELEKRVDELKDRVDSEAAHNIDNETAYRQRFEKLEGTRPR